MPLASLADATAAEMGIGAELQACAAAALPAQTMQQRQVVTVSAAAGWTRVSERLLYWRRTRADLRVLFEVLRPKTEAGLKLLVIQRAGSEPEIHVYVPDLGRARRVVGSGASNSVLGTDFSFEDAMHLQDFLGAGGVRQVADAELDGHPAHVAETRPSTPSSAYGLIRSYVDKASCLPLKTEFFSHDSTLTKTLLLARDALTEIGGHALPQRLTMINHALAQRTDIEVTDIQVDVDLPDTLFTLSGLQSSQ